ncbi:MAG: hypothetical protein IJI15_02010, partial [Atopobiaceae bacterium]|nr:hypothetical protein [Atopobiaceae bacterium]
MAAKREKREKTASMEEEVPVEVVEEEPQSAEPAEKKEPAKAKPEQDVSFTQNRELSRLRYDDRVLDES